MASIAEVWGEVARKASAKKTKKRKSINVILAPGEFRRLQRFCAERGHKKSTLVATLIRNHLDAEKFMMQAELPIDRTAES